MWNKNQIKANEINAPVYQDSTIINSPGLALRMVKGNPQMMQAFMDEIASAVMDNENEDYSTSWTLSGGKAISEKIPKKVSLYEKAKTIGVVIDPDEKELFEEWIKRACRAEDAAVILGKTQEDGEIDLEQMVVNPDNWVRKCEFGIMKVKITDEGVYKVLEDSVYYDNLFVNNQWKRVPEATVISSLNADRGFRPVFFKIDNGDIIFTYTFRPTCWNDIKWYANLQVRLKSKVTVYFRFADDRKYIFRKTLLPEWSINNSHIDYKEICGFIEKVELIEKRCHMKFKFNEYFDLEKCEFIYLLANSLQGELTTYEWEEGWFSIKPTRDSLAELIEKRRDEEFGFLIQEHIGCSFSNVEFERYRCDNILESVVIANYDEVQELYRKKYYPIEVKLKPAKNNKWHRILEIPGYENVDELIADLRDEQNLGDTEIE